LHWNAVGAGIRAEVTVEGTILLHDDHDVLDLHGRQSGRHGRRDLARRLTHERHAAQARDREAPADEHAGSGHHHLHWTGHARTK
jgi:hypothetical protein